MPKSAGPALKRGIYKALDCTVFLTDASWFCFTDFLIKSWFEIFARTPSLSSGAHLPATPQNVQIIRDSGLQKVVVQVRDPRQAVVSLLHHLTTYIRGQEESLRATYLAPTYFSLDFEGQLNWLVKNIYPDFVQWIADWKAFADDPSNSTDVLFLTFEDFSTRFDKVIRTYEDFYELPSGTLTSIEVKKSTDRHGGHFRKGKTDEWRRVMPTGLQTYCSNKLPDNIKKVFGWPEN